MNLLAVVKEGLPQDFQISTNLTSKQLEELIHYSLNDPRIHEFTSDLKRFSSPDSYRAWRNKHPRLLYILTDKKQRLMGLCWFSQKHPHSNKPLLPPYDPLDFGITFAIRTYNPIRGQGMALPFMRAAFALYKQTPTYQKNPYPRFWLSVNQANTPAIKLYTSFGFVPASLPDPENRILMILPE